jgi:hypothetical protein
MLLTITASKGFRRKIYLIKARIFIVLFVGMSTVIACERTHQQAGPYKIVPTMTSQCWY